jgi:hypothetical protein
VKSNIYEKDISGKIHQKILAWNLFWEGVREQGRWKR